MEQTTADKEDHLQNQSLLDSKDNETEIQHNNNNTNGLDNHSLKGLKPWKDDGSERLTNSLPRTGHPEVKRLARIRTISKAESLGSSQGSQTFGSHTLLSKDTLAVQVFHDSGLLKLPHEEDATSAEGTGASLSVARIIARDAGIYIGYLMTGLTTGLLGISLLELQTQTGADIDQVSFLLTWCFIGAVISTLLAGTIFDRLNPQFQFTVCFFTMALVILTIPWVTNYYIVSALVFVEGLTFGFISTTLNAHLFHIWKEKTGPFLQALHLTYSTGCMLGPVIANPFLTATEVNNTITDTLNQTSDHVAITNSPTTSLIIHSGTFYPFLIVGLCQIPPAIYFLVQCLMEKCKIKRTMKSSAGPVSEKVGTNVAILVLFLLLLFTPCGLETTFGGLLYTFAVKHLSWTVNSANLLTMTFWMMLAVCRGVSIFLIKILKPETLLSISMVSITGSLVVMATASHITALMWVATIVIGFALGSIIPNAMLYAGNFMSVSGKVAASFMASMYTSAIVMPLCLGLLFKHVGMEWFVYISIIMTSVMFAAFIAIRVVDVRCYKHEHDRSSVDIAAEIGNEKHNSI